MDSRNYFLFLILTYCDTQFCCTHDATNNPQAPTCKDEPNCRNYIPCYIVWWKLEDTVGPHDRALLPLSFVEKFPKTNFPNFFDWNNQGKSLKVVVMDA